MNAAELAVNAEMAWNYLEALAPDGDWTFQTFDDSEARKKAKCKRRDLERVIHCKWGQFLDVAPELARLNDAGAGIFLMVNRGDMRGRCAENVIALRALFVDGDGIPFPAALHKYPDLFVCRDEFHWHAYWLVTPDSDMAQFRAAQKRLAAYYHTDTSIHDLCRVMRVPGFIHRKREPALVSLEHPHHA